MKDPGRVTGKIIYRGKLLLTSPLRIGAGEKSDDADITILRDSSGQPFIPATSLIGVLRHFYYETSTDTGTDADYFWGSKKNIKQDTCQSSFVIRDLHLINGDSANIRVRDGIETDNKTNTAKPKKKYTYEIVEPGSRFAFSAEITLRQGFNSAAFKEIMDLLLQNLHHGHIILGAGTTRGFGRCRLESCEFQELVFTEKSHVLSWLSRRYEMQPYPFLNAVALPWANDLTIDAFFAVKNSFLIRSYSASPQDPDVVPISSNGNPVLPGTSLAGAIKARAEKIVNTLCPDQTAAIIHPLLGWADDQNKNSRKYKSRVCVEETSIEEAEQEQQTRISIDRFTGGTIKGALMEEVALWPRKDDAKMVHVRVGIRDYKPYEAGLLLLVLKDLWNADLPLGGGNNIGRGLLKGIVASICFNDKEVTIRQKEEFLDISEGKELLEQFVASFHHELKSKEAVASE